MSKHELDSATFHTSFGSCTVFHRRGTADWNNLYSCLVEDEYRIQDIDPEQTPNAIDIGAHIGGVSLAMAMRGMNVVSVEPLPENVELLKLNLRTNGFPTGQIWQRSIWNKPFETVPIYYNDTSTETGRVHEFIGGNAPGAGASIDTLTVTFRELIEANFPNQPFAVKIDCEGAEWEALPSIGLTDLLWCNMIFGEMHPRGAGMDSVEDLFSLLADPEHFPTMMYSDTEGPQNFYFGRSVPKTFMRKIVSTA
jgi:FkbM family methyltransferase